MVAAGLVWCGPQLLVQRRALDATHGGSWELPGGKLERGESPTVALARELIEEWGDNAHQLAVGPVLDVLHHVYPAPGPEVLIVVLRVDATAWRGQWRQRVRPEEGVVVEAFSPEALPVNEFLAADRSFLERVRDGRVRPARVPD